MLTSKQLAEIREHLQKAQNPVFFFDNDMDGLGSFLILQRFIGRGRGVAIKSFPDLNKGYFKQVQDFKADYVFVLDKPKISKDFIDLVNNSSIPLVYIDHHDVPKFEHIEFSYNTFHESKKIEPTSYLCYKVTNRKEDLWISVAGCIADCFIPEFLVEFKKEYPELLNYNYKTAFDIYYNTDFGKIIKVMAFGLLDKTTNVVSMLRYLMKAKGPYDLLEENANTQSFLSRFEIVNKRYQSLLIDAREKIDAKNNLLFFTYSGGISMSQELSNELMYYYPNLLIVVGYLKDSQVKFSLRGPMNVRDMTLKIIQKIDGASGGGHEHAIGAQMPEDSIEIFKKELMKELNG